MDRRPILILLCLILGETTRNVFTFHKERLNGEMITDEEGWALTSRTDNDIREGFI